MLYLEYEQQTRHNKVRRRVMPIQHPGKTGLQQDLRQSVLDLLWQQYQWKRKFQTKEQQVSDDQRRIENALTPTVDAIPYAMRSTTVNTLASDLSV